jgi:hypothetical protein
MSPLDYEILTDLAVALLIGSGYYIWFKIELKAQFLASIAATEKQLADAKAACATEDYLSKTSRLLRQASEGLREIQDFAQEGTDESWDDLIAARQQLWLVNCNIRRALNLRANQVKITVLSA